MKIFESPVLEQQDIDVITLINGQRTRLSSLAGNMARRRWNGYLRRHAFAKAIRGSNSIEGYDATMNQALAVIDEEEPMSLSQETRMALLGYRNAMTYILQASRDPFFEFSKQFLKSLHFMMVGHVMKANPGHWRPGSIQVVDEEAGKIVYVGPDVELVDELIQLLVASFKSTSTDEPLMVRAAMAHLNLVMIHPFSDGNGRMARALQTLVLARDGLIEPVFASIEEWLGRYTSEYYAVLAQVGQGSWNPQNDTLPWVRFCLKAHYQQAGIMIRRYEDYSLLGQKVESIIKQYKLPLRMEFALFEAARGYLITRGFYRQHEPDISDVVASRDLAKLADLGLLIPEGEKRGRFYRGSTEIKACWQELVKARKPLIDPYQLINPPI